MNIIDYEAETKAKIYQIIESLVDMRLQLASIKNVDDLFIRDPKNGGHRGNHPTNSYLFVLQDHKDMMVNEINIAQSIADEWVRQLGIKNE